MPSLESEVVAYFDELRVPLLRYLASLGVALPDAEEVIQEAFVALFAHLRRGGSRHNLRGWIFKVTHNQAMRLFSRRATGDLSAAGELLSPEPNPEEQAAWNQRQRRLLAVVRGLPRQDRACLALRAEGLRYREIADVLGISLGSVALSLERALARVRRMEEALR